MATYGPLREALVSHIRNISSIHCNSCSTRACYHSSLYQSKKHSCIRLGIIHLLRQFGTLAQENTRIGTRSISITNSIKPKSTNSLGNSLNHTSYCLNRLSIGSVNFRSTRFYSSSTKDSSERKETTSQETNTDSGTATTKSKNETDSESKSDTQEKKSRWSNWTGKNAWKASFVFLGLLIGGSVPAIIYNWGAPEIDEQGQVVIDVFHDKPAVIAYIQRALYATRQFFKAVRDPTSEKLLPDPLAPPYVQPPYTLVLELTDVLLKPQWDMKMGWRFKKRPGLDYFLMQCAQNGFEIVIFTKEPAAVAFPLTVSMDPQSVIWYRLFKEDTRYTSGVHIKDLNCLNRDLKRVILIDVDKNVYKLNPRNGLAIGRWNGDDKDSTLYDLAAFLKTVVSNKVDDVRTVLQYYNDFDDPLAKFRENQAIVMRNQEELMKAQEEEKKKTLGKSPFKMPGIVRR